jgi:hypothetical protein
MGHLPELPNALVAGRADRPVGAARRRYRRSVAIILVPLIGALAGCSSTSDKADPQYVVAKGTIHGSQWEMKVSGDSSDLWITVVSPGNKVSYDNQPDEWEFADPGDPFPETDLIGYSAGDGRGKYGPTGAPGGGFMEYGPVSSRAVRVRVAPGVTVPTYPIPHKGNLPNGRLWIYITAKIPKDVGSPGGYYVLPFPVPLDSLGNPVAFQDMP